ncbi:MAG TPA: hypothetical protein VK928_10325 [Longimicrobiales bacterium]|nr:hypothetical protein [Longimicrobiales bacterium]
MRSLTSRLARYALMLALVPALAACGGDDDDATPEFETQPRAEVTIEELRITDVELGRSVGPDNRILDDAETDDFAPMDTIYVAVATEGAVAGSPLSARWTFEDGQVVDESSQTISPTGPAVTHFHISKPDGFPVGNYSVEILLNGRSVEKKDFEVKQ